MELGYDKPLYVLPFDHRDSYVTGMFHYHLPLNADEQMRVADSKDVIYEGFVKALEEHVPASKAAILVDEEFGTNVLRNAARQHHPFALSVEASGKAVFEFAYGDDFVLHIKKFDPTFAKVLVRYNPDADADENRTQAVRLKRLSDHCRAHGPRFMFELLVPATPEQLSSVKGDKKAYDDSLRPALMLRAIAQLQEAGVEPDTWKIEGLNTEEQYQALVAQARRDGRNSVGCIVLGRGANEDVVEHWLATAVKVPGMIGFAVGRTCFWDPIAGYVGGSLDRNAAALAIAKRYKKWVDLFES